MEKLFYYPHGRYVVTETAVTQQKFDSSIAMHYKLVRISYGIGQTIYLLTHHDELITRAIVQETTVPFTEITNFRETGAYDLSLESDMERVLISRQTFGYIELYDILRHKIAVLMEAQQMDFPWQLQIRDLWLYWIARITTVAGYGARMWFIVLVYAFLLFIPVMLWLILSPTAWQQLTFASDTITSRVPLRSQKSWLAIELQKVWLQQRWIKSKYSISKQIHFVVLQFNTGECIEIDLLRAWGYGYSPERIVVSLHRLYPHTYGPPKLANKPPTAVNKQPATLQAKTFIEKGDKFRHQSKLMEAVIAYNRALNLSPDYGSYHFEIANILYELGHYHEAAQVYKRAFKLYPLHEQGWDHFGQCSLKSQNYKEAAAALARAVAYNPDDALSFYAGAMAYHKLGETAVTIDFLQKALTLEPDWIERVRQNPLLKDYLPRLSDATQEKSPISNLEF
jgi:tetratricopeptide (TPR) repeat protein